MAQKKNHHHHRRTNAWTEADRFAFATQKLRASAIPGRRFEGPDADEWDDDDEYDA